jgi:hypothetical protein
MHFPDIIYTGPVISDTSILDRLDDEHRAFLEETNGVIAFAGGLHVRGICDSPEWHSLQAAWEGPEAYFRFYPEITADDVPFSQDAFGDQFLLRDGWVIRLSTEDAEISETGLRFDEFMAAACEDPVEFLALHLLEEYRRDGGTLEPGTLLGVTPPVCSEEALHGVSLTKLSARDRFVYLANLAHMIRQLPRGDEGAGRG